MTTPPQTKKGNTKRTLVSQTQVYIKIKEIEKCNYSITKKQDPNKRSFKPLNPKSNLKVTVAMTTLP